MKRSELAERLLKWDHLGVATIGSGTQRYGTLANGRANGWLHRIFLAIPQSHFDAFEAKNLFQRDFAYPRQLLEFNGAWLFSGCLVLEGLHLSHASSIDYPFNMILTNVDCRKLTQEHDAIVIGGANLGRRSYHYLETRKRNIIAIDRDSNKSVFQWPDYETFFVSELDRLNGIFDKDGSPPPNIESITFG